MQGWDFFHFYILPSLFFFWHAIPIHLFSDFYFLLVCVCHNSSTNYSGHTLWSFCVVHGEHIANTDLLHSFHGEGAWSFCILCLHIVHHSFCASGIKMCTPGCPAVVTWLHLQVWSKYAQIHMLLFFSRTKQPWYAAIMCYDYIQIWKPAQLLAIWTADTGTSTVDGLRCIKAWPLYWKVWCKINHEVFIPWSWYLISSTLPSNLMYWWRHLWAYPHPVHLVKRIMSSERLQNPEQFPNPLEPLL